MLAVNLGSFSIGRLHRSSSVYGRGRGQLSPVQPEGLSPVDSEERVRLRCSVRPGRRPCSTGTWRRQRTRRRNRQSCRRPAELSAARRRPLLSTEPCRWAAAAQCGWPLQMRYLRWERPREAPLASHAGCRRVGPAMGRAGNLSSAVFQQRGTRRIIARRVNIGNPVTCGAIYRRCRRVQDSGIRKIPAFLERCRQPGVYGRGHVCWIFSPPQRCGVFCAGPAGVG